VKEREEIMPQSVHALAASRHFHLEPVAEGIYAALSIDGTGSMCNAGIIDLGDVTLVFDTFVTPHAAQDLRQAAEQLLGRPVAYVVNSHKDSDHYWGNQVFVPGVTIIATEQTRTELFSGVHTSNEQTQLALENEIREMEAKLAQEQNTAKRRSQTNEIASRREILSAIPTLRRTLPNLTFEQQLTLYGSQRMAQVLTYGGGHTASDAFLYLPGDQILFLGDLLFVRSHPWIGGGNPEEWVQILERVEQLDFTVAVPGHGPLGSRADLELNRRYLTTILALAQECLGKTLSLAEATQSKMPAPFDDWEGAEIFDWNMEFLYERKKA
jgi:cyclase